MTTPPILHRRNAKRRRKMQNGAVLSWTTMSHPLDGFGIRPRTVGLIELEDGTRSLGQLLGEPRIGQKVRPRMALSTVNADGLREYDVAYEPLVTIAWSHIAQKAFPGYILALTGPSGVGKTTVSRIIVNMFGEYAEAVPILTTRCEKDGDDGEYAYVTKKEFTEAMKIGDIASYARIPSSTEERWYGYRHADIEDIWKKGKLPLVITEMHLLRGLSEHYGRRSILSFGLLPPGKSRRAMLSALLHRLRSRGRDAEEHIKERLQNAVSDLDFFRTNAGLFNKILVNEDVDAVIAMLKKHVPAFAEAKN
ncbi:OB-fold domain-containing protein [Candidatus Peregrinibacteria bacterium]|nr:OB-fold domain-containing protein [Candidatus Peregrinibacteria bacterium]